MGGYGWVSLTSDYGTADGFAAACRGVIARIAPQVRVIDITHQVAPADVTRAAAVLAQTVPHLPPAVHLAVVGPSVTTGRPGIAVRCAGGVLVGPDNGLLPWAAGALGGIDAVVELANPDWLPAAVSRTFHGRDVLAPVAAHLAAGAPLEQAGPPVDPGTLVQLPDPVVTSGDGWLEAEVLTVDRFGNVQLAAAGTTLDRLGSELLVGGMRASRRTAFADAPPGELVVFDDSAGRVAIAVNGGRAVVLLSVNPGDLVHIGTP
jgi:hypothetical protein